MFFEDYEVGSVMLLPSVVVTQEEIIEFASRYDPQPFHTDPVAAVAGQFGGLIASGWHTCALTVRAMYTGYWSPETGMGGAGIDELAWPAPVHPLDELSPRATTLEARVSKSKPDRGIVRTRIETFNQDGVLVLSMIPISFIRRRPQPAGQSD